MEALADRNRQIKNIVKRIARDAQAEITPTAAREYAEIDILCAELWVARKVDQYAKLAKLRFDMAVRLRLLPAVYRPSTSLPAGDDPYVKEHLRKIGELDGDD